MNVLLAASKFSTSPDPYIALMGVGFAVGIFGHLYGSRLIVGIGVAMIFLATLLIPLAMHVYR